MTMTDPIADMLTRLRNANVAHHDTVRMPSSKVKEALAAILVREGYITSFKVTSDEKRPGSFLEVTMKYAADRTRTISGVSRRTRSTSWRCGRPILSTLSESTSNWVGQRVWE